MATTQNDGAGRPPPYKAGDYQTRYSYEPPATAKEGLKGFEGEGSSANAATGSSYRLAADAVIKS